MKNIGLCLALVSLLMVSCEKKVETKTTETIETNTVDTDTVIVKDTDTVVKEKQGTTVKVSGDGLDVDSKDVDVEIKK